MQKPTLAAILASVWFAGPAIAQSSPNEKPTISKRLIQLTAEQEHVIKENIKDVPIAQVAHNAGIEVGDKISADIRLQTFPPLVIEKVPQVKTYKFFVTDDRIVLVSPNNTVADLIDKS